MIRSWESSALPPVQSVARSACSPHSAMVHVQSGAGTGVLRLLCVDQARLRASGVTNANI